MRARSTSGCWAEDSSRPLHVSIDLSTGRITPVGELDRTVAHRLGDAVQALTLTRHHTWTVDLAGLTFCDAEGLRALEAAHALADRQGRRLRLVELPPFASHLLWLVGLGWLADRPVRSPVPRLPTPRSSFDAG